MPQSILPAAFPLVFDRNPKITLAEGKQSRRLNPKVFFLFKPLISGGISSADGGSLSSFLYLAAAG